MEHPVAYIENNLLLTCIVKNFENSLRKQAKNGVNSSGKEERGIHLLPACSFDQISQGCDKNNPFFHLELNLFYPFSTLILFWVLFLF